MSYQVKGDKGRKYEFSNDQHDLVPFEEAADATVTEEEFTTVARWSLDEAEGVAFGVGNSRNPDRAEGYNYFDAVNADATAFEGRVRYVVLNAANDVVATISRHRAEQLRAGSAAPADRRDRAPYPYQNIRGGSGEVIGGDGHKVAIQLQGKQGAGLQTFDLAASEAVIEGYRGRLIN